MEIQVPKWAPIARAMKAYHKPVANAEAGRILGLYMLAAHVTGNGSLPRWQWIANQGVYVNLR
jgi:hypothetical protein